MAFEVSNDENGPYQILHCDRFSQVHAVKFTKTKQIVINKTIIYR